MQVDAKVVIHEIMKQHVGKNNAIKVKKIKEIMGLDSKDTTDFDVRKAMLQASEEYGFPLGSGQKGCFIIETFEELEDYSNNLESRMRSIQERLDMTIENFCRMNECD